MTTNASTVYTGRVTNAPLLAVVGALGVVLLVGYLTGSDHPVGLLVGAVIVIALAPVFSTISLAAGPRAVTVRYGFFGLPRRTYPISRIESAEPIEVSLARMGGWGWHWSPWRGTRMTVRSGPTLRLTLTDGAHVAISAPDPATAARVVNTARGRTVHS